MNIRARVKRFLLGPAFYIPRRWYNGLGSVLMYHRVTRERPPVDGFNPYRGLAVHESDFEEQIAFIRSHARCLDLRTAVRLLKDGRLPENSVVVTFDDGYRDNLTLALPILERYDVPATIFVSTGLVERTSPLWWYELEDALRMSEELDTEWRGRPIRYPLASVTEKHRAALELNELVKSLSPVEQAEFLGQIRATGASAAHGEEMLTWGELGQLDRSPLITIGAHTRTHPVLSRLTPPELEDELLGARRELEERLGHQVPHLAYPFGGGVQAGWREFQAAEHLGFECAVTTRFGHLHHRHRIFPCAIPRINIAADDSMDDFAWKMSGLAVMAHHRARRFITA